MIQSIFRSFIGLAFTLFGLNLFAQSHQITFRLDMRAAEPAERIGVRGDLAPLSWEKTWYLSDEDQDGIFTGTLLLEGEKDALQYKYVRNENEFELFGADNRVLPIQQKQLEVKDVFNQYTALDQEALKALRFPATAIREDVRILKQALQTIHPNLSRYVQPLALDSAFVQLEQQLLSENDLASAYKYITRLLARIRCSHTITNPWNQQWRTKQALYFQKNHLPFTFQLIEGRMFIERNATEDLRLAAGVEVLSINNTGIEEIIGRLLPYVSADGGNDAKRRNALQLGGAEKFENFDIFYALEFEPGDQFQLELRDSRSGQVFQSEVAALTKTGRDAILRDQYPAFMGTIDELWQFRQLSPEVAYLKLGTFTVWNMKMDWRQFLADAFGQLQRNRTGNLIIDIRGNVGGADEVYQFILERLLREDILLKQEPDKVAYSKIPEQLRPHISTWDDAYYDLSKKTERQADGYYLIKKTGKSITVKARKDGFSGKTFLITDASNSSATHHMAALMKQYGLGTLVGQATGGNQRGMNGGLIFFTTLPNTQIEVDIPVFGGYTPAGAPDSGIVPDIPVEVSAENLFTGRDPELEAILAFIKGTKE